MSINVTLQSGGNYSVRLGPQPNYNVSSSGTVAPLRFTQLIDVNVVGISNGNLIAYDAATQTFVPSVYAPFAGIASAVVGGIASITQLNVTGVSTLSTLFSSTIIVSGSVTSPIFIGNLLGTASYATTAYTLNGVLPEDLHVAYADVSGISTLAQGLTGIPNISVNNLNVSGIATIDNVQVSSGVISATSGIVTYYGDGQYLQNVITGVGIGTTLTPLAGTGITTIIFDGPDLINIISGIAVTDNIATINIGYEFPLGDYGDFTPTVDAFSICIGECYDCLTDPARQVSNIDLGSL